MMVISGFTSIRMTLWILREGLHCCVTAFAVIGPFLNCLLGEFVDIKFTYRAACASVLTEANGNVEPMHAAWGDCNEIDELSLAGVTIAGEEELEIGNAEPKHVAWDPSRGMKGTGIPGGEIRDFRDPPPVSPGGTPVESSVNSF